MIPVECGPGWKKLYEPLIALCQKEGVEILQIKEKFGTLRFYVGSASDEVHYAISVAEDLSAETCEQCGNKAKTIQRGWLRTLCKKCSKDD